MELSYFLHGAIDLFFVVVCPPSQFIKFKFDIIELEVSDLLQLIERLNGHLIHTAEVVLHFDHLFLHEAVHVRHHLVSSPAKCLIALFKDIQVLHLVLDFKDASVEFLFKRVA